MNTKTNTGCLKPCPLCGGPAESWQEAGDDGRHAAFTGCMDDDCRAKTGPWPTRIDSEIAWNQRTDDAPPVSNRATITVPRYRDSNGHPTCCAHTTDAACPLMAWTRFGFDARCQILGADIERRTDELYSLRPLPECPVWKGVKP